MPRDVRAYLADIVESCDAITVAVREFDLARYQGSRLVRSSVEREFIIIGEAAAALARFEPEIFEALVLEHRNPPAPAGFGQGATESPSAFRGTARSNRAEGVHVVLAVALPGPDGAGVLV
jgi:hypothetical protein